MGGGGGEENFSFPNMILSVVKNLNRFFKTVFFRAKWFLKKIKISLLLNSC